MLNIQITNNKNVTNEKSLSILLFIYLFISIAVVIVWVVVGSIGSFAHFNFYWLIDWKEIFTLS